MDYRDLVEFDDIIFVMDAKNSVYNRDGYVIETIHDVYIFSDIYEEIKTNLETNEYYCKDFLGEYLNVESNQVYILYYIEHNTIYQNNRYYMFGYIGGKKDIDTISEYFFKTKYVEVYTNKNLYFIDGL